MCAAIQGYRFRGRARRHNRRSRSGKIVTLLAIALPTLCGLIGMVVDLGLLFSASRQLQHACDAAATAAALEKHNDKSDAEARAVAESVIRVENLFPTASLTFHSPPTTGPYSGSSSHVELLLEDEVSTHFMHVLGGSKVNKIRVRSVAGYEDSTSDAAIVVLDPDPPDFQILPIVPLPILAPMPAIVGGLEALGVGETRVNGAVLVNTEWAGRNENGEQVGNSSGPGEMAHAVSATPVGNVKRLLAADLRVVGGVDDPDNYGALNSNDPSPLKAGRLPVPDPFLGLPVPTTAVDPLNVSDITHGGVSVTGQPLVVTPTTLLPGVYDWIEVTSGTAQFEPGVYIIREVNPNSQLALNITGGRVIASGVMFYITDSVAYSPTSGLPDANDGESTRPLPGQSNIPPCAVINIGLLGSQFSGLNSPDSPFHQFLIYQRRHDRRPIVLVQENLIGAGQMRGTVYTKWGHVVFAGKGAYDVRIVAGTVRLIALQDMQFNPTAMLPPAEDVYLVE